MGLLDILGFRKKGLNPNDRYPAQFPMILQGAAMGSYNNRTSVDDSYASNADVYAIVSLLARKAA